jgi:hypothetical protein
MKHLTQAPLARNTMRWGKFSVSAVLFAAVFAPAAIHAQLNYVNGTVEEEFDAEPVAVYGGNPPLWVNDTFTGLNDILSSPGGGFNEVNYAANGPIANSGVNALPLNGYSGVAQPGFYNPNPVAFGGGSIFMSPYFGTFAVGTTIPGSVSVVLGAESANFTVGALGVPLNIGTYLSVAGGLGANDAVAAGLVTYVTDTTKGTSATFAEVLGATGVNSPNTVALSGAALGLGIPVLNGNTAAMLYANGDTLFNGLSVASLNFAMNPGDNVTIESVFTAAADPFSGSYIDSSPLPNSLDGLTLPGLDLFDTPVPEPGTLSLFTLGLTTAALMLRKRFRA